MVTIRLPEAGDCWGPWNNTCKGLEVRSPLPLGSLRQNVGGSDRFQGGLELYSHQHWIPAAASSETSSSLVHKRQVLRMQN